MLGDRPRPALGHPHRPGHCLTAGRGGEAYIAELEQHVSAQGEAAKKVAG